MNSIDQKKSVGFIDPLEINQEEMQPSPLKKVTFQRINFNKGDGHIYVTSFSGANRMFALPFIEERMKE